jgi:uncharacterized membrane protein (DUF2068 family)
MYLPWEVLSIIRHPHPYKWIVLAGNLAIVLYMLVLRMQAASHKTAAKSP